MILDCSFRALCESTFMVLLVFFISSQKLRILNRTHVIFTNKPRVSIKLLCFNFSFLSIRLIQHFSMYEILLKRSQNFLLCVAIFRCKRRSRSTVPDIFFIDFTFRLFLSFSNFRARFHVPQCFRPVFKTRYPSIASLFSVYFYRSTFSAVQQNNECL